MSADFGLKNRMTTEWCCNFTHLLSPFFLKLFIQHDSGCYDIPVAPARIKGCIKEFDFILTRFEFRRSSIQPVSLCLHLVDWRKAPCLAHTWELRSTVVLDILCRVLSLHWSGVKHEIFKYVSYKCKLSKKKRYDKKDKFDPLPDCRK